MGSGGGHSTNFSSHTLEGLKAMVRDTRPDKVEEIAHHWMYVHDQLAGDAPDGSVKDLLDKAVADVREYWHGAAAEAFEARAKMLSTSLKNGAMYAKNTSHVLQGAAADLREVKRSVMALQDTVSEQEHGNYVGAVVSGIKDGAKWLSNFGVRDDSGLKQDVAHGMSVSDALAKNDDTLSRGKEIALRAAAHMERLGASYNVKANQLTPPPPRDREKPIAPPDSTVPPPDVAFAVVPAMASPRSATVPRVSGRKTAGDTSAAGAVASPRPSEQGEATGRSARPGTRPPATQAPNPGTALDGVRGGVPSAPSLPGTGSAGPVVGQVPGNSGSGPDGPGLPAGGPVIGGRGPLGGRTMRPGSPGTPSTPPGGRAGAGRSTVPGAPGQPGRAGRPPVAGATDPGASGKGGVRGRQGGLARRPGGVVGEPSKPGVPGRGAQGGSGLHRSRGGALSGGSGGSSRARGPLGIPANGRPTQEEKRRRQGLRPDYLVEDEETWVSQRDVVPGVVGVSATEEPATANSPEQEGSEAEPGSSEGSN
ncbi:hypothetical protein SNOUR_07875 [Streptomyces noursei ATCC 11455]|nr:hypothetical protein SNOUR_07875 [Streptomyces noursei ATCC 11455]